LRSSHATPARTNWDAVVNSLTNGMARPDVRKVLAPFRATSVMGNGFGDSHSETYRLDDAWILECWFRNQAEGLTGRKLSPSLRNVWCAPPSNFTGLWIKYFVNGQKSHEIHFDAGKYDGEFIAYNPDGSRCYVQHYDHHVAEGADTGYFASGRTNYQGVYRAGRQVGTWVWYNEDGSVKSTQDFSK
jgi:hypothetical protein